MIKVLFVCMGNICRSPTAHAVFANLVAEQKLSEKLAIDSAGTDGYHLGCEPDERAQQAAQKRGIKMDHLVSRMVEENDFDDFDYIIAMDNDNVEDLKDMSSPQHHPKISLLLDYASSSEKEVPDPYYGGDNGFELVLDLVEDGTKGLLERLIKEYRLQS